MTVATVALETNVPLDRYEAGYLEFNGVLPIALADGRLRVAIVGEPSVEVLDDLGRTFQHPVEVVPVSRESLSDGVRRVFAASESTVEVLKDLDAEVGPAFESGDDGLADARDLANQAPVIKFVNLLIREAHDARASDIHIESTRAGLRVRFRVDGVLSDVRAPTLGMRGAVINRVKLLAHLDIAERRASQDGRIRIRLQDCELDLRVSSVPALYGESVVLRLLDRGGRPVGLDELGMAPEVLERFRSLALRPHGIVLATGPTGSGKTTTLYSALALRDVATEKVITIEDPVEYHLEGVMQVPVVAKVGMTFGGCLRSLLRQDPNVVMVGEMRDAETAGTAVQGAMTGHLVFSTLHTNDAVSAVARLADLQVEPYMVASALEGVLAQRLVRRICPECREDYEPHPPSVSLLSGAPVGHVTLVRGRGCRTCRDTGYRGRIGIFELLVVTEEIKDAIAHREPVAKLRDLARAQGMPPLWEDGWIKVQAGVTTVEEVLRVTVH